MKGQSFTARSPQHHLLHLWHFWRQGPFLRCCCFPQPISDIQHSLTQSLSSVVRGYLSSNTNCIRWDSHWKQRTDHLSANNNLLFWHFWHFSAPIPAAHFQHLFSGNTIYFCSVLQSIYMYMQWKCNGDSTAGAPKSISCLSYLFCHIAQVNWITFLTGYWYHQRSSKNSEEAYISHNMLAFHC